MDTIIETNIVIEGARERETEIQKPTYEVDPGDMGG